MPKGAVPGPSLLEGTQPPELHFTSEHKGAVFESRTTLELEALSGKLWATEHKPGGSEAALCAFTLGPVCGTKCRVCFPGRSPGTFLF